MAASSVSYMVGGVLFCALALSLSACSIFGWGGSAAPSPRSSNGALPGNDYAGSCPSQTAASWALDRPIERVTAKLHGLEYDCSYYLSGHDIAELGYLYNDHVNPASLLSGLERFTPRSELKSIPGVGSAAYEQTLPDGSIGVTAIAHGYTISLVAVGVSDKAAAKLVKLAVGAWSG